VTCAEALIAETMQTYGIAGRFGDVEVGGAGASACRRLPGSGLASNTTLCVERLSDPAGNRIVTTESAETTEYVANNLNQYAEISVPSVPSVVHPTHDADGNMVSDGNGWHYAWNGENRLILASNAQHIVTYAYDHRGRMVRKDVSVWDEQLAAYSPQLTAESLWDGWNLVGETVAVGSGSTQSVATNCYTWGLDLSGMLQDAGGVGGLLAVTTVSSDTSYLSPLTYYPLFDANGNVTEYVATNGTVAAHYEYSAFGETTSRSGPLAEAFTHRFSTKPWCGITGLSEYELRQYRPDLGRWVNRDPISERGGVNPFGFVDNNPAGRIDLLGLSGNRNDPPSQVTQVSRPCCGGQVYDSSVSCCIDGVITSREPQSTGVTAVTEYGRTDPYFGKPRDWLVQHAWIEFPGGSTGFGPNGNPFFWHRGLVGYPDGSGGRRNDKTDVRDVKLSPCDHDIQRFVDCVSSKPVGEESKDIPKHYTTGRLYCAALTDCRDYQADLINKCAREAAR